MGAVYAASVTDLHGHTPLMVIDHGVGSVVVIVGNKAIMLPSDNVIRLGYGRDILIINKNTKKHEYSSEIEFTPPSNSIRANIGYVEIIGNDINVIYGGSLSSPVLRKIVELMAHELKSWQEKSFDKDEKSRKHPIIEEPDIDSHIIVRRFGNTVVGKLAMRFSGLKSLIKADIYTAGNDPLSISKTLSRLYDDAVSKLNKSGARIGYFNLTKIFQKPFETAVLPDPIAGLVPIIRVSGTDYFLVGLNLGILQRVGSSQYIVYGESTGNANSSIMLLTEFMGYEYTKIPLAAKDVMIGIIDLDIMDAIPYYIIATVKEKIPLDYNTPLKPLAEAPDEPLILGNHNVIMAIPGLKSGNIIKPLNNIENVKLLKVANISAAIEEVSDIYRSNILISQEPIPKANKLYHRLFIDYTSNIVDRTLSRVIGNKRLNNVSITEKNAKKHIKMEFSDNVVVSYGIEKADIYDVPGTKHTITVEYIARDELGERIPKHIYIEIEQITRDRSLINELALSILKGVGYNNSKLTRTLSTYVSHSVSV